MFAKQLMSRVQKMPKVVLANFRLRVYEVTQTLHLILFIIDFLGLKRVTDDTVFDCMFCSDNALSTLNGLHLDEFLAVFMLEVCSHALLQIGNLSVANLLPPRIPQLLRLRRGMVVVLHWTTEHGGTMMD